MYTAQPYSTGGGRVREWGEGVRERHIPEDRLSRPLAPVYPQVSTSNTRSFNSGQAFQVNGKICSSHNSIWRWGFYD